VRELLEQAARRGPLTRVEVTMKASEGGAFETVVADDAEPERRRRSFEAIEERVKQLHGSIHVDVEEPGTRVVVTLPAYASRR
jgi:signal transduction histidine kinase